MKDLNEGQLQRDLASIEKYHMEHKEKHEWKLPHDPFPQNTPKEWEKEFDGIFKSRFHHIVTSYKREDSIRYHEILQKDIKAFISSLIESTRADERKKVMEHMREDMRNWHGNGQAMVEDYAKQHGIELI